MPVGWKATVAAPACAAGTLRARRFSPTTHQVIPPAIAAAPTADQAATAAVLSCWVSFLIPAATPTAMIAAAPPATRSRARSQTPHPPHRAPARRTPESGKPLSPAPTSRAPQSPDSPVLQAPVAPHRVFAPHAASEAPHSLARAPRALTLSPTSPRTPAPPPPRLPS